MLMDLLHGFEVLSTTEETLFNSRNVSRLVQNKKKRFLRSQIISFPPDVLCSTKNMGEKQNKVSMSSDDLFSTENIGKEQKIKEKKRSLGPQMTCFPPDILRSTENMGEEHKKSLHVLR